MPPGHGDRRKYLSNLALRLARRYERSKDRVDIDKAIEIGDQVLKAVPEDHADRMAMLSNHALWLYERQEADDVQRPSRLVRKLLKQRPQMIQA